MSSGRMKANLFFILIFSFFHLNVHSIDLNLQAKPQFAIPVGEASSPYYGFGGGFTLSGDMVFNESFFAGPEFAFYMVPLKNTTTTTNFVTLGGRGGYFFFPQSRLRVQGSLSLGAYSFSYNKNSYGDIWFKLSAEGGYRFTPELTLNGELGYLQLNSSAEPLYSGITAGIAVHYRYDTQPSTGKLEVDYIQSEPVYPIYAGLYKENSLGTLTIQNNESAEITQVNVSFKAGNYTSSQMLCGSFDLMKKFDSFPLPLFADFSDTIQNFTEDGKIPGELIIEYKLLGATRTSRETLVIPVYNRNSIRWTDPALLASFASPTSPEVLDYSKYAVGIARNQLRSGLNREMQFAMYLFEGLKVGGISYSFDNATPYMTYHLDQELIDYVQYPFQTLAYHSGDYDDLGLLLASALESVGIKSALIPLENDFIVAFYLNISQKEADNLFDSTDRLLNMGEGYWIPLSMSVLREGFINSWYRGLENLYAAIDNNENINLVVLQDAWATYPPTGITGSEAQFQKPVEEKIIGAVETDLMRYITAEFGPKIKAVQDDMKREGPSRTLYNRLGLLYVRAGLYDQAKEQFLESSQLDSASARINLGNIALLERKYEEAEEWFLGALEINPDSQAAAVGLEKAQTELDE
jgi:hypothetical protein